MSNRSVRVGDVIHHKDRPRMRLECISIKPITYLCIEDVGKWADWKSGNTYEFNPMDYSSSWIIERIRPNTKPEWL